MTLISKFLFSQFFGRKFNISRTRNLMLKRKDCRSTEKKQIGLLS